MSKTTKYLTGIALVAATAVALAGCSSGSGSSDSATSGDLTVLSPWSAQEAVPIVKEFNKKYPDIKVKLSYQSSDVNALNTQLVAGTAPDVIFANPGAGQANSIGSLASAGHLVDLSARSWASGVTETYRGQLSDDGKLYGYPSTVQTLGGFYNTDTLAKLGLKAPTTWSELLQFCASANDKGVSAYALGGQTEWIAQLVPFAFTTTLVEGETPDFEAGIADGTSHFADSKWVDSLQRYQDMIDAKCFQPDASGTSGDDASALVTDGKAIAQIMVSAAVSGFVDKAPEGTYEFDPIPATDDAEQTKLVGLLSTTMGINSHAKHPKAAMTFIDWASSDEGLAAIAKNQVGTVPAVPSDSFEAPALLKTFEAYLKEGRTTVLSNVLWPNPEVSATFISGAQAMLLGQKTPKQVAEDMDASVKVAG